jgi:hypothetical protein
MASLSRSLLRTAPRQSFRSWRSIGAALPQRYYSIHADHAAERLQEIDPTKLSIQNTGTPKKLQDPKELLFGHSFSGKPSLSLNWLASRRFGGTENGNAAYLLTSNV